MSLFYTHEHHTNPLNQCYNFLQINCRTITTVLFTKNSMIFLGKRKQFDNYDAFQVTLPIKGEKRKIRALQRITDRRAGRSPTAGGNLGSHHNGRSLPGARARIAATAIRSSQSDECGSESLCFSSHPSL